LGETLDLGTLIDRADSESIIGIGLTAGDPREEEILSRTDFCPLKVFRNASNVLRALDAGEIRAGVRGSLEAGPFLSAISRGRHRAGVRRIALLRLPDGKPFLLAPVGIDEGGNLRAMRRLVRDCRAFCGLLGWEPRIGVLSSGRVEDAGRGRGIAASIERGERLAAPPDVRHFYITVEEAIGWSNAIIAPDGVTGNLIYRTLVHLGSGSALGALYFPLELRLADTSRSGMVEECLGAIALANIAAQ
jgi:predicted methyltransferase MtxX (methanogen marker protein 4)